MKQRGRKPARRLTPALAGLCLGASLLLSCGGSTPPLVNAPPAPPLTLTASDVQAVVQQAAQSVDAPLVIAVTDRLGRVLAVFRKPGAPATVVGDFGQIVDTNDQAVNLARTAGFFSNDTAPLSSRTVRFISAIFFPPGIAFTNSGPLYSIEDSNRGCSLNVTYLPGQAYPPSTPLIPGPGLGIITGKADTFDSDQTAVNPGGVPLFKTVGGATVLVGGVGVVGPTQQISEYAAFFASTSVPGFGPQPASPGVVVVDGVTLPFVNQTTLPAGSNPGTFVGAYTVGPLASPGPPPVGDLIQEKAGTILTLSDVQTIIQQAVNTANITRAAVRLPNGSSARVTISVVGVDGTLLAHYHMDDALTDAVDAVPAKARTVVWLSSPAGKVDIPGLPADTAVTTRTVGFGAQPLYPPGVAGSSPGPWFSLYQFDVANPCTLGSQPANPNQNNLSFFPGSEPLYKNGVLAGGIAVSGDGADQNDFIADGGAQGFQAPLAIRADQFVINGARLPYLLFPRNPTLGTQPASTGSSPH